MGFSGSPASGRGAPTLAPVPSKGASALETPPARGGDIEVLPFDPSIAIPVAKAVPAPPADIEVLAFEPDIQVAGAKPTVAPSADIEVLSFDAEPPVVSAPPVLNAAPPVAPPVVSAAPPVTPPTVSAAPAVPPVAKPPLPGASAGSTSSVRAFKVTAASYPASTSTTTSVPALKPTSAAPASAPATAPASPSKTAQPSGAAAPPTAAPVTATPAAAAHQTGASASASASKTPAAASAAAAPPTASPSPNSKPATTRAAKAAPAPSSTAQTAALPVVSDTDEVGLIQDTGPVPVLSATSIEPAPDLPPLEPLSVEESATDLTLFAQELIKLRSNGRTRRYEVLARSQRDLHRNEVPAAFVAESARGKDGAALDSMVMERLLTWLGKHGEAIWDSEPASFSVNVSIGAIEDETFLDRIEQWLEKNSVPAEYVGFEISEVACVQHKPAVQRFVEAVEKMGCFLVIDNFSLDSAVFEFLGSKALRHVKLDPKLTVAAMKEKLPQALVVAILQACKVLGVHCVAKRVESQSSMQWLTAVGCDFAQSFSLQKPLPLESLASGAPIKALRE
jgi:EAL domain-containing protein (putative c-di-GMP-specific phosphodiesterase class I)